MSSENIRTALGLLQEDADNETAWEALTDELTSQDTGMPQDELADLLQAARREHEARREWNAVVQLLELELAVVHDTPQEPLRQADLARVFDNELLNDMRATKAYERLLKLRPDDPTATEALERYADQRERWKDVSQEKLQEAEAEDDPKLRSKLFTGAVTTMFRFGRADVENEQLISLLNQAIELDRTNLRACVLLEQIYADSEQWEEVCQVLEIIGTEAHDKAEQVAAWLRMARVMRKKLKNEARAIGPYQIVVDLVPGQREAMNFLSDYFSRNESWEHLIALYEDQLRGGAFKKGQEFGIWLQIAMIQWRMRERPDLAEPYFEKVRRVEPTHPGMLDFYRSLCESTGDNGKLVTILTDAQRAMPEGEQKTALASEIARLAESQEDVHKAIDQYKALLRKDRNNVEARDALKRLYRQTAAWSSLVDVLRHELDSLDKDDADSRLVVLREISEVYRDNIHSDSALVTVLNQIVQLDPSDISAVRELCRVYESLQRWRDLLAHQQKLAELTDDREEKVTLLRLAGKRWFEQFQNVQNATHVYEALLELEPSDEEARERLAALYKRRRAWPQMYALMETQLEFAADEDRVEIMVEMAKLAAERLDRPAEAISLYKKVLEIAPEREGVLDSLEKFAERSKDYATVAEVLDRRVGMADDEKTKISLLQKLGSVYSDRLKDHGNAAGAWKRVLELRPDHRRALHTLRDTYLAAGDFDAIEELYGQTEDWEGLAEVLSGAADKAEDVQAKIELSFRSANVYETKLQAPERSFRSYERVLAVEPDNLEAASKLVPIYENDERWVRLPALYSVLLQHSGDDIDRRLELLKKLVDVAGNKLSDRSTALGYARQAYELAPEGDGALAFLEEQAREAGVWGPCVEAIEAHVNSDREQLPPEQRRRLQQRLAELYATEMDRVDDAVKVYRALLEEQPDNEEVIERLDALLRSATRRDDLRWLFQLRIDRASEQGAVQMLIEWAEIERDSFGDAAKAMELFTKVLDLDPRNADALQSLPPLLMEAGEPEQAVQVLEKHRDQSEGEERSELEMALASWYIKPLGRHEDALHACERALEQGANPREVVPSLRMLMDIEETRADAAKALVGVYEALEAHEDQAAALRILIDSTADDPTRLGLLANLAELVESKLNKPEQAFEVLLSAVSQFPEELVLWDRMKDLAADTGRAEDLVKAYEGVLENDDRLPDLMEVELCKRAASLCQEQIGDPDAAVPYLERVLARQPANAEAFQELKQILIGKERWEDLEAMYARAIAGTTDNERRIDFLREVAMICGEIIQDATKAIDYYERILDIQPLNENAIDSLEKLYASEEKWDKLVSLLERRLDSETEEDELANIKLQLGSLHLDHLNDPGRALPYVRDVLRGDVNEHDARELAERILEVPELRGRAAEVLENVYQQRDEIRDLVRVLQIRHESTEDQGEKRSILRRIATLRDERLADDDGAFDALAALVPAEPVDVQARQRLIEIGRRLGVHERVADVLKQAAEAAGTPDVKGAILMDMAAIVRDHLGDPERAESIYLHVLSIDENDAVLGLPAAHALEDIYASTGKHAQLVEILRKDANLEDDVERRGEIYARLGEICETILDDPKGAINAWKSRLDDDASDDAALAALERLYGATEEWIDLVDVLRLRQELTDDSDERRREMVSLAEVLTDKIEDVPEAITAWRALMDDFGPEPATLRALEQLYRKAEQWTDLAETIEIHLDEQQDIESRLDLLVALGDVRREHRQDLMGALDAYRQALTISPSHVAAREAIEGLLDEDAAKREAAQILHPLYETEGNHAKLLRVVRIEAESAMMPDERLEHLAEAVRIAEGPLDDTNKAFEFAVQGLREAAGGDDVSGWLETVERLAAATSKYVDMVALLRDVADEILDGEVQLSVYLRIAELARTELGDPKLAEEYYTRALDLRGDSVDALVALERLYEEQGEGTKLLEILRRRVDSSASDDERKELLFRQARLCSSVLDDRDGAIEVYERILEIELDAAAVAALEDLYEKAERPDDLIAMYERQLSEQEGGGADLHVKIAKVASEKLGDVTRGFDELAAALAVNPQHEAAIEELERILEAEEEPENKAHAAEMLGSYYYRNEKWDRVKVTIEARLEATDDSHERRQLLRRLALTQEEQEEDFAAAMETTAKLLHEDITDQETWGKLESQSRVIGGDKRLAEILAAELDLVEFDDEVTSKLAIRTGELFAQLGDIEHALTYYRRALRYEPESEQLFDAIDKLLVQAKRPQERVDLYRAALEHRFDPEPRLHTLHTIAELERKELGEPDAAIDTYRSALDVNDNDEVSLNALTELYRERERFDDLADLYLRRAEAEVDPDQQAQYRMMLARLLRDEKKDLEGAVDRYEEVVQMMPSHEEAIQELEQLLESSEELQQRIVDILLPIYEGADDWRKLIQLSQLRFKLASDDLDRVNILRDTAKLWEERGDNQEQAFEALRGAFALDPEDLEIREELDRLAGELDAWDSLADTFAAAIDMADGVAKRDLLKALATIHDRKRDAPRAALKVYGQLHELEPTDESVLEEMDMLATLLADWSALVDVLVKKAEFVGDDEQRASSWRRVGECKRDMLADPSGAVEAFEHAMELDPMNTRTMDALIALYEERQDASKLVDLYQRRVEFVESDEDDLRYELLVKAADVYQDQLDERTSSIEMLRQALDVRAADEKVLRQLEKLFREEQMWLDLLDNLKLQASVSEDADRRIAIRRQIGVLLATEMNEPGEALDAFRLVLDDAPEDAEAVEAVQKLAEDYDELRLEAAEILEPVLRGGSDHKRLVSVLELRLQGQSDPEEKATTLRAIANVYDENLGNKDEALGAMLRALAETPSDESLHADIERVAEACEGFGRYSDALKEQAEQTFETELAVGLWKRLGRICEERLNDDKRSVEAYGRALEQAGDEPELLDALDRLLTKLGDNQQLSEVIERRVSVAVEPTERADLYNRMAKLQINAFGDKAQALETLRMALEENPEHQEACETLESLTEDADLFEEVVSILDNVYNRLEDYARLAALYEKRISFTKVPSERLQLRLELASFLEDKADDSKAAQKVIEGALADDPADPDLIDRLEQLAGANQQWTEAAGALGDALDKADDLEPSTARDVYVRLAAWYRDRLSDRGEAEKATLKALSFDEESLELLRSLEELQREPGRERELVATLRKRAVLELDAEERRNLFREAKMLAETSVEDMALTEEILAELIGIDESYLWAYEEMTKIAEQAGKYDKVVDLLLRRAELTASGPEALELRHRAAKTLMDGLEKFDKALEIYQGIFDDEPTDMAAAKALRELYAKQGQDKKLAELIDRLIDVVSSVSERTNLRIELAQLHAEKFDDPSEAVLILLRVLDEEPGQKEAVVLLSQIYEKTGRDEDLAELLNSQIALARERDDADAELTFTVRLGEVYDSRLNDKAKAIDTFKQVLERDANHRQALEALGRLFEDGEEYRDAADYLERLFLSLDGGDDVPALALRLNGLFAKLEDDEAARRVMERALDISGGHEEVREQLRELYERTEAWDNVARLLAEDAENAADDKQRVTLLVKAAKVHADKRNDSAAAAEILEKAGEIDPDDRAILLELCDAYSASGRAQEAIEALEKIVKSYGGKRVKELAPIHHRLARAYLAEGDDAAALTELDRAFSIMPGNLEISVDLGLTAWKQGDLVRARKTFQSLLLQRFKGDAPITKAEVFFYLGDIAHKEGDKKKAKQMLKRALDNNADLQQAKDLIEKIANEG